MSALCERRRFTAVHSRCFWSQPLLNSNFSQKKSDGGVFPCIRNRIVFHLLFLAGLTSAFPAARFQLLTIFWAPTSKKTKYSVLFASLSFPFVFSRLPRGIGAFLLRGNKNTHARGAVLLHSIANKWNARVNGITMHSTRLSSVQFHSPGIIIF